MKKLGDGIDHGGSTFDSFLEQEGIWEEVEAVALRRVQDWKSAQAVRTLEEKPNS
ncbi:MAG: hypothetical protein WA660_06565 [Candidatus Acidiferrales bacterium]